MWLHVRPIISEDCSPLAFPPTSLQKLSSISPRCWALRLLPADRSPSSRRAAPQCSPHSAPPASSSPSLEKPPAANLLQRVSSPDVDGNGDRNGDKSNSTLNIIA